MADSLQVPKDLKDEIALRQFLIALSNNTGSTGAVTKNYNIYPTESIPMDTTKYDEHIEYDDMFTLFNTVLKTGYTEYVYTDNKVTQVNVWEDNLKTNKLYTKDLTYTDDKITQITITDEQTSNSLTKTITYSGDTIDTVEVS